MRPLPRFLVQAIDRQGVGLSILVVRLGALGDILRTLPPVRLLRRGLPRATIRWVVEEKWRVVLEGHQDLDGLVTIPRRRFGELAGSPRDWIELLRSIRATRRELRSVGAHLLLEFHGNLRSGLTAWCSGTAVRLGYAGHQQKEGNHWLTTHRVPSGDRRTPRMERNLDLIRALGIPDHPLPDGGLPVVAAAEAGARRISSSLAKGGKPLAIISPGVSRAQAHKKPPPELLAAATRRLDRFGLIPLVVWGPGEEDDARRLLDVPGSGAVMAPPTDLPTLTGLLRLSRLFVGGDSGPLHLACAVGCPVLGLYGPTDPRVNAPWGVPHRAISPEGRIYTGIKRRDRAGGAFRGLSERQVETAVEVLLAEAPAGR